MPGIAKLECNSLFKGKCFMQFKTPGEVINGQFHAPDLFMVPVAKGRCVIFMGSDPVKWLVLMRYWFKKGVFLLLECTFWG